MTSPVFIPADLGQHRDLLIALNVEYMVWNSIEIRKMYGVEVADVVGMPVADYVASVIDKVCGEVPPRGCFYLIAHEGAVAGMGGLRQVREGVAELKRVYVRPAFRGKHLGEAMIQQALGDAKAFGFHTLLLDSGPFMHAAHRLYEAAGFVDAPPYPEAEVPTVLHRGWRFMTRAV